MYDSANRLNQVNGQSYTFDNNGNLKLTGAMTNTFDAANRLISSSRAGVTVQPIYNGVGERVGQTVGTTTTHFALDVAGLPEVIYTSSGEIYLHLPGVIVTQKGNEVRYLLSDGLGSIRQAVDESRAVVAYNEFDPYGNPVNNTPGGEPYGYTGEWWESYPGLLHLRVRWYWPHIGIFLSRDPHPGEISAPATFNGYNYANQNPTNLTDPSGLYVWYNIRNHPGQWQHERIERWFEQSWAGANGFWRAHLEFNQIPGSRKRPDIIYFPDIVPSRTSSPIDFSNADWIPRAEIYEIEPMYPQDAVEGLKQVLGYFTHLSIASYTGSLRGIIAQTDSIGRSTAPHAGQAWNFNMVNWDLGTSLSIGPHVVPMTGQGDIWLVRPIPGLILYADDNVRESYRRIGTVLSLAALAETARQVLRTSTHPPKLSGAPACSPFFYLPGFFFDPNHPYNPVNPLNCLEYPEFCGQNRQT